MDQRVEGGAPIWGAWSTQGGSGDIRARSHQPELDLGALAELRLALGKTNLNFLMAYIFCNFFVIFETFG